MPALGLVVHCLHLSNAPCYTPLLTLPPQQLLWKLGDSSTTPAAVARAFCQQFVQQPQQLEREAGWVGGQRAGNLRSMQRAGMHRPGTCPEHVAGHWASTPPSACPGCLQAAAEGSGAAAGAARRPAGRSALAHAGQARGECRPAGTSHCHAMGHAVPAFGKEKAGCHAGLCALGLCTAVHAGHAQTTARLPKPQRGCPLPQVRAALPHLELLFCDDPVWDLGAPRAACEQYVAQVG